MRKEIKPSIEVEGRANSQLLIWFSSYKAENYIYFYFWKNHIKVLIYMSD